MSPRLLSEEFELLYDPSDKPQSQLVACDEEIIVEWQSQDSMIIYGESSVTSSSSSTIAAVSDVVVVVVVSDVVVVEVVVVEVLVVDVIVIEVVVDEDDVLKVSISPLVSYVVSRKNGTPVDSTTTGSIEDPSEISKLL